jgi:hypothetical protein
MTETMGLTTVFSVVLRWEELSSFTLLQLFPNSSFLSSLLALSRAKFFRQENRDASNVYSGFSFGAGQGGFLLH